MENEPLGLAECPVALLAFVVMEYVIVNGCVSDGASNATGCSTK
jgi:hypothetical protein